jgi:uncharacterized protein
MNTYPAESWMSSKLATKDSPVHGGGVFAVLFIKNGEVLVRWGGTVYTTKQLLAGETNDQTACQIDDELYIADPPGTKLVGSDLMNHSCDPNTWMDNEVTISARRDIAVGEEVTADYALWVAYPGYITIAECHCGSPLCRHQITGDDWKLPELQKRYKGHFPPYLERRIERSKGT